MLKVYLVCVADEGESHDWFVSAETPEQAILLWREHLLDGGWCDDEEAAEHTASVALTPPPATTPMVHRWDDLFVIEPKEDHAANIDAKED
jgi:hypothetical protein